MNSQQSEPDSDAIKMFIGQIPRHWEESDLRSMLEEFGPIHSMNILRDRATGQSKGCCFVTFFTRKAALDSQNALHNIKTLPTMHRPVQVKPADSEKKSGTAEDRKLFVVMIPKSYNEAEVRNMFVPFGTIDECAVLRDPSGTSRGCAFVTFSTKQSAQNAIKSMHHSQTMEGCSSQLVVKLADTQKEKEQRKASKQATQGTWNTPTPNTNFGGGGIGPLGPQQLALLQQVAGGNQGGHNNQAGGGIGLSVQQLIAAAASGGNPTLISALANLGNLANCAASQQNMNFGGNAQGGFGGNNQGGFGSNQGGFGGNNQAGFGQFGGNSGNMGNGFGNFGQFGGNSGQFGGNSSSGNSSAFGNNMNGFGCNNSNGLDALTQAYSGIQQYAASFPNAFNQAGQFQQNSNNLAGSKQEGPDGANLFIYHLPQEFGDMDLMQTFMPFGTIISAKVFVDKQTNLSKCFGFVSYDNAASAQSAIQSMNGFQMGMKRLKVQLKRAKSDSKPY